MRDFGSGWSGLKEYAISVGVATVDDTDDSVAAKIKAVIQGTKPEPPKPAAPTPPVVEEPSLLDKAKEAVGLGGGDDDESGTDTESET